MMININLHYISGLLKQLYFVIKDGGIMELKFVNNDDIHHYEINTGENYELIKLDKKWFNSSNSILLRMSVDNVIKKIAKNEYENNDNKITQDKIIDEYDRLKSIYNPKKLKSLIRYLIEKPTYLIIALSSVFAFLCFIGKIFLYGYYFKNVSGGYSGLLSLCLNPIPMDIFSSALVGAFILMYIFLLWGTYIYVKSEKKKKIMKMLVCISIIAIITFLTTIIFSDFDGRTLKFKFYSLLFYTILPSIIILQIYSLDTKIQRMSLMIISMVIVLSLLVGAIIIFRNKEILWWISNLNIVFFLPLSKGVLKCIEKLIPDNNNNIADNKEDHDRCQIKFNKYNNFRYRFIINGMLLVPFLVLLAYCSFLIVYTTGSLYSDISVKQYSLITIDKPSEMNDKKSYFGTIVAEKNDSYYISTEKSDLLMLKTNNLIAENCEYFENPTSERQFKEQIKYMKSYIKNNLNKNYVVEFVNLPLNSNGGYHHIVSPDKSIEINIHYSTNLMNEVSSISICLELDNKNLLADKNLNSIKNKYLKTYNMEGVNIDNSIIYYDNGILTYEISEENNKYKETYKFVSTDIFWEK